LKQQRSPVLSQPFGVKVDGIQVIKKKLVIIYTKPKIKFLKHVFAETRLTKYLYVAN